MIKYQVFQERLRAGLTNWRTSILPGSIVIAIVILARFGGGLQVLEWMAFDRMLRYRPAEAMDDRVLIVGINDADVAQLKTYPVPDAELASLIQRLQQYQPAAIGVDIIRDHDVAPGSQALRQIFKTQDNVIGIERLALNPMDQAVQSSPDLPEERVGFANAILDSDGALRRSLLFTEDAEGVKISLTELLADSYLGQQQKEAKPGILDPQSIRFGNTEVPRLLGNTGGYAEPESGGLQTLINFRSGKKPFQVVSLAEAKNLKPEQVRGKVILVGMMAESSKDYVTSHAIVSSNPALVYGIEIQAHAVSQLISAAEDGRPLIRAWADGLEYVWIIAWGGAGIVLGWVMRSPLKLVLVLLGSGLALVGMGYGLIILGWWIPVVPPLLVFLVNGAGLTAFYRYDQQLRSRIRERQTVINRTFDAIHSGPLQTLSLLQRRSQDGQLTPENMLAGLQALDREVRRIYNEMEEEVAGDAQLSISQGLRVNLTEPMHEVLRQVYEDVLARDEMSLQQVKLKLVDFQPIDERFLDLEMKQDLCRFLEEAITNVGKHGVGVTRLEVRCQLKDGVNVIRIADNGMGDGSDREGRGTQQAKQLAKRLRGEFERSKSEPQGMICQLSWKSQRRWLG